ncbi:MAG: hypothetical protein Q9168_007027 [Polycauliona sp. 1 TL-2023]
MPPVNPFLVTTPKTKPVDLAENRFLKSLGYSFSIGLCSEIHAIVEKTRKHINEYEVLLDLLHTRAKLFHPLPQIWQSRLQHANSFDDSFVQAHQNVFGAMGENLSSLEDKLSDQIMTLRQVLRRAKYQYREVRYKFSRRRVGPTWGVILITVASVFSPGQRLTIACGEEEVFVDMPFGEDDFKSDVVEYGRH